MPFAQEGKYTLEVYFGGKEFPFSQVNTLNYVHMAASTKRGFPHLVISLTDGSRWLNATGSLADGTVIRVSWVAGSVEDAPFTTYEFMLTASREKATDSGLAYEIEGVLNNSKWITATTRDPIKGTSSVVLESIAKMAQMSFLGVGTSDDQIWYPANRRLFSFARNVASRGFATDTSCMQMAVDLDGTLIYRDVTSMDVPVDTFSLLDLSGKTGIPVAFFRPSSFSGAGNLSMGYAYASIEQRTADKTLNVKNSQAATVVNDQGSLMVNGNIQRATGDGVVSFEPPNPGNTHPKFERAYYQNRRVDSLFNVGLEITVPVTTKLRLLDTVFVSAANLLDAENASAKTYEGSYRVDTRIIYIQPSSVVEKYILRRRTMNQPLPDSKPVEPDTQNRSLSVALTPPVGSSAGVTSFLPGNIQASVGLLATGVTAALAVTTSALTSATSQAASTSGTVPPITTLLPALLSQMTAITNVAVEDCDDIWDVDALGTGVPAIVATAFTDLATVQDEAAPDLEIAARQAAGISNLILHVNSGAQQVVDQTPDMSGPLTAIGKAISAVSVIPDPDFELNNTSLVEDYEGSKAAQAPTVAASTTAGQSMATAMQQAAATYQAQIDALMATCTTRLNQSLLGHTP